MKITIEVSNRVIEDALVELLEDTIFDSFEARTLKTAKIPSAKKIIKDIMSDEKFLEKLAKDIRPLDDQVNELVYDRVANMTISLVDDLIDRCDQVAMSEEEAEEEKHNAQLKENMAKRDTDDVARMVKALGKLGYMITKTKPTTIK
jgi:uncharacterized protein (UPF0305 family)